MEEKPVKKKRGRKPKKKNEEPIIENEPLPKNLVIKLTEPSNLSEKSSCINNGYEENTKCQMCYGEEKTGELCWNCCHDFDSIITGIPMKHENGIFYTYGDFCSLECCARYAFEYFPNEYWEILSIINLYNHKIYNNFQPIEMAPSKLVLKRFGGKLTIEDYRTKKDIYNIQLPPILPINHINTIYEKKQSNQLENLKLYRKKKLPSDKKSITQSMNLIVS